MFRHLPHSIFCVFVLGTSATPAMSQTSAAVAVDVKAQALQWLDRFSREQALFHEEDVKKLREKVEAMPPEEVAKWWQERTPQRELLDSPQWRETQTWLREFLRVQARYSDEDIRTFQSDAFSKARESAESLSDVLKKVMHYRQQLRAGSQAAEQTRQLQLAANQAFRQDQVRQREARWQRPAPQPNTPQPVTPRERPGRSNEPLVDSLDVARWMMLNQLYPRW